MSLAGGDFDGDRLPDLAIATLSTSGPSPIGEVTVWRGQGDATFAALPPAVAGISPRAVDVGDVNADGQLDVAVATSSPNGLIMLLGRGDGTFQALPSEALGGLPRGLTLGDFNGDGRLDVVVATSSPNALTIGLSRGDGTFQALPPSALGGLPTALALADFNGDGKLDLFVTTSSPNTVAIFLGQGDGTLAVKAAMAVSGIPRAVAVGDFNGDGRADIAATTMSGSGSVGTGSVTMLLGQGDGTFQVAAAVEVGNDVGAVVAADVNGDSRVDLAVISISLSDTSTRSITVLLGQGDGTFVPLPAVLLSTSFVSTTGSLLVGDANGDGMVDLAVANSIGSGSAPSGSVAILLGQGDGTFQTAPTFVVGSNPVALVVDDFDGDGQSDVATANQGSFDVSILFGRDDGTVDGENVLVGGNPAGLAVGDFNGDGVKDMAVALSYGFGLPAIGSIATLIGQSDGTFLLASSVAVGGAPAAVAVGDFNQDGRQDLAVANQDSNTIAILLGQGDGAFEPTHNFLVGINPRAVVVADLNADGQLDLAVANSSSNMVSIWLGRGDGSFQATPPVLVSGSPVALVVGDFNEDGRLDVAVARQAANAVAILLGQGDGSFQALPPAVVGSGQSAVAVGDFDGDGHQDVAMVTTSSSFPPVAGNVAILFGQGDGTFHNAQAFLAGSGSSFSTLAALAVGDFDGDGWPDLAVVNESSDMVTILLNNTPGFAVATAHLR